MGTREKTKYVFCEKKSKIVICEQSGHLIIWTLKRKLSSSDESRILLAI